MRHAWSHAGRWVADWFREMPPEWVRENTFLLGPVPISKREDQGNVAIIGGIGSGKTSLLEVHMDSLFKHIPDWMTVVNGWVGDPKNDLFPLLSQKGLPLKVISAHVLDRDGWAWRMWEDLTDPVAAEQFAYDLLPDERGGGENNKFFTEAPRHIFAGVVRTLVRLGRPWTLRQAWHFAMDELYARQLFEMSSEPEVRARLALLDREQGTAKANIHSSLLTKLGNVAMYAALMDRCTRTYSIKRLVRGEQVFVLGSDFRFGHILSPMNNVLLSLIKRELIAQGNSRTRRHYVLVDEFPKLNNQTPAEEFPDFCELGRSRGVRVVIVIHSPQQLVKLYGAEGADIILGQCQHKLILKKGDFAGAQYCSNLLGRVHRYEWVQNRSYGGSTTYTPQGPTTSWTWGHGASEVYADRPLVPPDVLMDQEQASRRRGFRGYGISPALPRTKRFAFFAGRDWLARHLSDVDTSLAVDANDELKPFPNPRPAGEQRLRPLEPTEVEGFGLVFNPDGYRP